jgi:ABC-type branched-subunit amino acid transport system permease subunit
MRVFQVVLAVALLAGASAICLLAPGYYAYLVGTLATTALVGVGLNVLLGLSGEVSLGQCGFVAIGAYGVAILTTKAGLNFWEALPVAMLLVGAISAALSIPALRLTGPYLAMVTIAFGFIVESVSIEWRDLTGGSSGLVGISAPFGTGGTPASSARLRLSASQSSCEIRSALPCKRLPRRLRPRQASASTLCRCARSPLWRPP